ncbi:MAG: porin [Janthinobacterium lividum]
MKASHAIKAVLAFTALSGAVFASAQSSVTLYGRVNTTVERQKIGDDTVTGLFNNSSRFGFTGSEDMGGGLRAGFALESGFASDTGVSSSTFFGRRSEVNLSGGFGTVRMGRWFAESYYATADYVSLHNHDTGSSSDALYAYVMRDTNKIAYRTPSFGNFTLEGAVGLHEQDKGAGGKNAYDLAANYTIGNLALGAGYTSLDQAKQVAIRALYTIGPFVVGGYVQRDQNAIIPDGGKRNNVRLSAAYLVGNSEFHVNVGRAGSYSRVADTGASQYTLGYNYNLSKRTKIYGYYTHVNNQAVAGYQTGDSGVDFSSIAVGVRHNF